MKILILFSMLFLILGCAHKKECPKQLNLLPKIDSDHNNFKPVPFNKYANLLNGSMKEGCVPPESIMVPNSILILDKLVKNGGKVALYIRSRDTDGGSVDDSMWENLFINIFSEYNNFSVIDSAQFPRIERTQAGISADSVIGQLNVMSQEERTKVTQMSGVTHMYVIDSKRERRGPIKTDYFSGRLIDVESGKVLTVDIVED